MKKLLYIFLVIGLVSCSKVKPKGEITTKDVNIQDFNKLDVSGKFKIFYVQNPKNMVSVETYPNVFDNLKIEVKDKTLYISEKSKTEGVDMYNIMLYSKNNLESIAMADSTDITISSQMSVPAFKLKIKDHAKFMGSVLANKADITMTNKAKANLLGRTLDANVAISDTASIISPYWYINNLNITSKNGNYSEFSVDDELNGSLGNTAELVYYGNPQKKIKVTDKAKLEQKQKP